MDLDGTLMVADRISDRVATAVRKVDAIIPVSIATGRRATDTCEYAAYLGLRAPQISNGGASVLDPATGQSLWESHLPEGDAQAVIELLDEQGVDFIATHPTGDAESVADIHHWDLTRISAMDIPESEADALVARYQGYERLTVVKVYLHYNGWWAVDFTARGVDKGAAAQQLATMLGTTTDRFIAAGDSFNDLSLLAVAGYKIAMGSAPRELQDMADFVAPTVEEDGLAVAIEQIVLPKLLARV